MTILDMEEFGKLGSDASGHQSARLTVVDATFASPQLLKPIKYGVDIVIHSAYVYTIIYACLSYDRPISALKNRFREGRYNLSNGLI